MNGVERLKNIKVKMVWAVLLCLILTPILADDVKQAESKRHMRMFRPMIPIMRSRDGHSKVEKGKLTISTTLAPSPPSIPVITGEIIPAPDSESLDLENQGTLDITDAASIDEEPLSKSDIPPPPKKVKTPDQSTPPEPKEKAKGSNYKAPTSIAEISGPPTLENLRASAHVLAKEGLDYKFGRDNPTQGGMDCSSTLQFLLTKLGIKDVPRTSYDQYDWLKNKKLLDDVYGKKASSKLFKKLSPGDLIFWGGTWKSGHRVSHVMMYMGYDPKTEKHYVFGAQSKSSKGVLGNGVDVFELEPNRGRLIAHGKIPGLKY